MCSFVIVIDASSAFDRVSRIKLWIKMFEMMIRPIIILALRAYYQHFYVLVKNDNNIAASFLTTYGVKQGGIISSELYKLYSEQIAIQYGKMNIDIIMYADDIIIIARTATEAQIFLQFLHIYLNLFYHFT